MLTAAALASPEFSEAKDNFQQKFRRAFADAPESGGMESVEPSHRPIGITNENKARWAQVSAKIMPILDDLSSSKSSIKNARHWLLRSDSKKNARTIGKIFLLHLRGKMIDPKTGNITRRISPALKTERLAVLFVLNDIFQYELKRRNKMHSAGGKERVDDVRSTASRYRDRWAHLLPLFLEECSKDLDADSMKAFQRVIQIWNEKDLIDKVMFEQVQKCCHSACVRENGGNRRSEDEGRALSKRGYEAGSSEIASSKKKRSRVVR